MKEEVTGKDGERKNQVKDEWLCTPEEIKATPKQCGLEF
jgi:hypothetical protein